MKQSLQQQVSEPDFCLQQSQLKEMLPIYDKPTIQYLVEETITSGINNIIIITSRNKKSIEDHFYKSYELEYTHQRAGKDRDLKKIRKITALADITYVRQKNLRGLGDAIQHIQKHVNDEAFAVLLGHSITKGSLPCPNQLIDVYEKYNSSTVALMKVPKDKLNRFKIIKGNEVEKNIFKITDITERFQKEKYPSNLAVMGRCILTPDIFDKISETEMGFGGEIHLTDALLKMNPVYGAVYEGKSYYLENRLEWLRASIEFGLDDEEFRSDLIKFMRSYI